MKQVVARDDKRRWSGENREFLADHVDPRDAGVIVQNIVDRNIFDVARLPDIILEEVVSPELPILLDKLDKLDPGHARQLATAYAKKLVNAPMPDECGNSSVIELTAALVGSYVSIAKYLDAKDAEMNTAVVYKQTR